MTVALPEPEAPDCTVTHDAALDTDHVHADAVLTSKAAVPPDASTERLGGSRVYVHERPCCVTVTVWPATVSVPVLGLLSANAAAVKVKEPGPVTDVPPVAVIQAASERPVQAHWLPVVTMTEPAPPRRSSSSTRPTA